MVEEWKPVPDYEGQYEISNHHRVRKFAYRLADGRRRKERLVKITPTNGYLVARLGRVSLYVEKVVGQLFPITEEVPTKPGEEWRDIRGYEGLYRISNFGRVYSIGRLIDDGKGRNRYIRPRVRELGSDINGYPKVELARAGGTITIVVHRLVADAFIPNPLNLPFVHHVDEDRENCRADNLEWITRAGNVQDWFDRRRIVVNVATIEGIIAAHHAGKTAAEILAALPRKRKPGR